jgi:AbrB family looped-hinge helix DNA binding protein
VVILLPAKCKEGAMQSAITSKGQATIPKAVRDHLKLKPGDRVKFFLQADGSVALRTAVRLAGYAAST